MGTQSWIKQQNDANAPDSLFASKHGDCDYIGTHLCALYIYVDPHELFYIIYFSFFGLREADFSWELRSVFEIVALG